MKPVCCCEGRLSAAQRNWRGDVDRNYWSRCTDAHRSKLDSSFYFPLCWLSVLCLFFYLFVFLFLLFFFPVGFPVSIFPDRISLLLFRCSPLRLFFFEFLLLSLVFLLLLLYLQLQRFLCRKRFPRNHKLPIFQKQITQSCIRRNHVRITSYAFLPQVVKHFFFFIRKQLFFL